MDKKDYKILFVCLGNICRSPMAEFIMKHKVAELGVADKFEIASAGTSDEERGNPVYPPAREMLKRHGIGSQGKYSRQIVPEDYSYYDLIIGMDSSNIRDMHFAFDGDPEEKIRLLLDYTERSRNIADPWYTGDFQATWDDVNEGCDAMLASLDFI
ncbi:MAG TPA: low molecular weight protein-tyrosine-phosphatase [Bacteroidales bacterium]|jgi:protein-tyrosine phosphatase|nr:low molecular weight protein-tyrosine-phosphatase [Bacteroidales bacterium]HQN23419.1 low molecular weight protein-tyrosine-phosphatase [Bacteroidales bacterium]HQP78618.1 low molecular weight protein-tyrosine-phosphatase [Bacteroidales bacterium]